MESKKPNPVNKKPKPRKIYRSAISGRIVSCIFALANPDTTVSETISLKTEENSEEVKENGE